MATLATTPVEAWRTFVCAVDRDLSIRILLDSTRELPGNARSFIERSIGQSCSGMAVSAPTPFARALANDTPESSIESGLISETAVESNLGERLTRVQ